MNPFEKHSINWLSPSSLNLYAANPSLWVGRYMMGWKDEMGPAGHRGTSVETGLDLWLFERDPAKAEIVALNRFADLTGGQADEDHGAERAMIPGMLAQAILALKHVPKPVGRQLKIEHWANGVEVPIIGYVDYLWEEYGIDLKTTKACPSSIKPDHGRQVATYAAAKQRPFKVLYVTAKKSNLITLSDNEAAMHLRDLERQARAIRHLLARSDDGADAAKFFAPDPSDFRWSIQLLEKADELYRAA